MKLSLIALLLVPIATNLAAEPDISAKIQGKSKSLLPGNDLSQWQSIGSAK